MIKTVMMNLPGKVRKTQKVQILPSDSDLLGVTMLGSNLQKVVGLTVAELNEAASVLDSHKKLLSDPWVISQKRTSSGRSLVFSKGRMGRKTPDFQRTTLRFADFIIAVASTKVDSGLRLVDDLSQGATPYLSIGDSKKDDTVENSVLDCLKKLCNVYSYYFAANSAIENEEFEAIADLVSQIIASAGKVGKGISIKEKSYGPYKQVFVTFFYMLDYLSAISKVFPIYHSGSVADSAGAVESAPAMVKRLSDMNVNVTLANYISLDVPQYLGAGSATLIEQCQLSEIVQNVYVRTGDGNTSLASAFKIDSEGLSVNEDFLDKIRDEIFNCLTERLIPAIKEKRLLTDQTTALYNYIGLTIISCIVNGRAIPEDIRLLYKVYSEQVKNAVFKMVSKDASQPGYQYRAASLEVLEQQRKAAEFDAKDLAAKIVKWIRLLYKDIQFSDLGVFETYVSWSKNQKYFDRIAQVCADAVVKSKAIASLSLTPFSMNGNKKVIDGDGNTIDTKAIMQGRSNVPYRFGLAAVEPSSRRVVMHVEADTESLALQTIPDGEENWYSINKGHTAAVKLDKSSICEWLRQQASFLEFAFNEEDLTVTFVQRCAAYSIKPPSLKKEGVFLGDWMQTGRKESYLLEVLSNLETSANDGSQGIANLLFAFPSNEVLGKSSSELEALYNKRCTDILTSREVAVPDTVFGSLASYSVVDFASLYLMSIAKASGGDLDQFEKLLSTIWLPNNVTAKWLFDSSEAISSGDSKPNYRPIREIKVNGRYMLCKCTMPAAFVESNILTYYSSIAGAENQRYKLGEVLVPRQFCVNADGSKVEKGAFTHAITITKSKYATDLYDLDIVVDLQKDVVYSCGQATEFFLTKMNDFGVYVQAVYPNSSFNTEPRSLVTKRVISANGVEPFLAAFKDLDLIDPSVTADENAAKIIRKMVKSACSMTLPDNAFREPLFNWLIFAQSLIDYGNCLCERYSAVATSIVSLGISNTDMRLTEFCKLLNGISRMITEYLKTGKRVFFGTAKDALRDQLLKLYQILFGKPFYEIDGLTSDVFPVSGFDADLISICYDPASVHLQKPSIVSDVYVPALYTCLTPEGAEMAEEYVRRYVARYFEKSLNIGQHGRDNDGVPTLDQLTAQFKDKGTVDPTYKIIKIKSYSGSKDSLGDGLEKIFYAATGIVMDIKPNTYFSDDGENELCFISHESDDVRKELEDLGYTVDVTDLSIADLSEAELIFEIKKGSEKKEEDVRAIINGILLQNSSEEKIEGTDIPKGVASNSRLLQKIILSISDYATIKPKETKSDSPDKEGKPETTKSGK